MNEKPVIPQFVADWIDVLNLHGNNPLREYRDLETDFDEGWTDEEGAEVYHWINKNPYAFIDALRYGYEVEKEQKYIIKFAPSVFGTSTYGSIGTQNGKKIMQSVYGSQEGMIVPNQYTRREIEEVGSKYMIFAEEVVE